MSELATWLLQQIENDESVSGLVGSTFGGEWGADRRRIVVQCQDWLAYGPERDPTSSTASFPEAAEVILRLLAAPYSDRRGYLELWRP